MYNFHMITSMYIKGKLILERFNGSPLCTKSKDVNLDDKMFQTMHKLFILLGTEKL